MKKLSFFIFTISMFLNATGQQFSFKMNFVDAIGNKDSIILGYDNIASDTIDPLFNEINILSTNYIAGLDVRIGNTWWRENSLSFANQAPFQTKTQIAKGTCGTYPIEIDIVTKNWPLTAVWDKNLFQDTCRNGSLITGIHPLGWWDTGGFRDILISTDTSIFNNQYYFMDVTDTVFVCWVAIGDSGLLSLSIDDNNYIDNFRIYPNPASGMINLQVPPQFGKTKTLKIFDYIGQLQLEKSDIYSDIDISSLPSGLYFIVLTNIDNDRLTSKIIKE